MTINRNAFDSVKSCNMSMPGFTAEASLLTDGFRNHLAARIYAVANYEAIRLQAWNCQCQESECLRGTAAGRKISARRCREHDYAISDDGNIRLDKVYPWRFVGSCARSCPWPP
jgi:hypothetical protein